MCDDCFASAIFGVCVGPTEHCSVAAMAAVAEDDFESGVGDVSNLMKKTPAAETDEATTGQPASGKGRGRGRGRGGRGEGRQAKGKEAKSGPQSLCICPGCVFVKYPGSRFCAEGEHKKACDNILYQRRSRKDISEAQRQAFDLEMASDQKAGEEVAMFARDNPPSMRRKSLVDFAKFERRRGVRASAKDSLGDVAMTKRAFMKHCTNTLGLEDTEAGEQLAF